MTYTSRRAATATTVAEVPTRILSFPREALEQALQKRPILRYVLQASFNRNLIDKLLRSTSAHTQAVA